MFAGLWRYSWKTCLLLTHPQLRPTLWKGIVDSLINSPQNTAISVPFSFSGVPLLPPPQMFLFFHSQPFFLKFTFIGGEEISNTVVIQSSKGRKKCRRRSLYLPLTFIHPGPCPGTASGISFYLPFQRYSVYREAKGCMFVCFFLFCTSAFSWQFFFHELCGLLSGSLRGLFFCKQRCCDLCGHWDKGVWCRHSILFPSWSAERCSRNWEALYEQRLEAPFVGLW